MSDKDTRGTGEAAGPEGEAAPAELEGSAGEAAPAGAEERGDGAGAGLRVLGAAVTLPWLVLYGVTGVSAVTRAAQAYSAGRKQVDAGYTRFVSPGELAFVGALLLAAFAVMMACALLLLFRRRSAAAWLPLLLVAAGLTGGRCGPASVAGCILCSGRCSSSASSTSSSSPWCGSSR